MNYGILVGPSLINDVVTTEFMQNSLFSFLYITRARAEMGG